ncbi:cytochrome P450 [Boletus edulis]|uniref:Cytochrome P450 n=1 Tax=Boletus edulis BED1 TaxID=1328754 RepID=A0AAD4BM12_BOLED|nr:cytochrome P450 [Boletus edulis]KAF8434319.1 cytochrome P450 [Boletus edulis BED1]
MIQSSAVVGLAAFILVYALFKRSTRPSLSMIRGPPSPSFVFGNLLELFQRPVGEADFSWQSHYGNVVRFKSVFGEDRLLIADPKALRKILNISTDSYPKLPNYRVLGRMITGKGIIWADGEDHARQRSIMLPGFGSKECKAFLPIFRDCADSLSIKWMETIESGNSQGVVINIRDWLLRGAFDAIGRAVFDVQFNAIQDDSHPVTKKYKTFFDDIFGLPSAGQLFMQAASKHIPVGIFQWLTDNGPGARLARARDVTNTATNFAKELVQEKAAALLEGKGNTDAFTLLIKANMDANAKKRLSDEELLAQMRTLLIAGYETTANATSWILLELARNHKVQSRLRDEIRKTEATIQARGEQHLTMSDLEAMPYLSAVIKEGLRFHPTVPLSLRMAGHDDILPLSKPLLTESGDMINEILVPKGTEIVTSICAYNRDRDLWGEDAHEFNPDRWLDGTTDDKKLPGIGMYSNLLTFYSGTQGCIGWRFAVIQMQALLSTLVGKFEFAMTDKAKRIIRQPMIVMSPMIEGELDHGVQMPLAVSLASKDGEI